MNSKYSPAFSVLLAAEVKGLPGKPLARIRDSNPRPISILPPAADKNHSLGQAGKKKINQEVEPLHPLLARNSSIQSIKLGVGYDRWDSYIRVSKIQSKWQALDAPIPSNSFIFLGLSFMTGAKNEGSGKVGQSGQRGGRGD